jgi:hypothetical protein
VSFYNIEQKEQILAFLDTKKKSIEQDPDQRWITTWNHNLTRIKQFDGHTHTHKHPVIQQQETPIPLLQSVIDPILRINNIFFIFFL